MLGKGEAVVIETEEWGRVEGSDLRSRKGRPVTAGCVGKDLGGCQPLWGAPGREGACPMAPVACTNGWKGTCGASHTCGLGRMSCMCEGPTLG